MGMHDPSGFDSLCEFYTHRRTAVSVLQTLIAGCNTLWRNALRV